VEDEPEARNLRKLSEAPEVAKWIQKLHDLIFKITQGIFKIKSVCHLFSEADSCYVAIQAPSAPLVNLHKYPYPMMT
jgi:hypothetical protein